VILWSVAANWGYGHTRTPPAETEASVQNLNDIIIRLASLGRRLTVLVGPRSATVAA
jgi:hypothetical protein